MGLINTYDLATDGHNSIETYTKATKGLQYQITIEDIITPPGGGPGDYTQYIPGEKPKEEKKKKKITVTAYVGGIEYKEYLIVEDRPNLTIKDVGVEINKVLSESTVKIKIRLLS
jgi:hypothetical protein